MSPLQRLSMFGAATALVFGLLGCREADTGSPGVEELGPELAEDPPLMRPAGTAPTASSEPVADHADPPAIAVMVSYEHAMRMPEFDHSPRLVIGAWKDGRMIWSEDSVEGGPPYRQGRTRPEQITRLLSEWDQKGLFAGERPYWASWGPDSAFTIIGVQDGDRRFRMESWHELFEAKGTLVATAAGITALNGRNIQEVLAAQPLEYREPRSLWQHLRASLQAAIPAESEPVGEVDMSEWGLEGFGK